MKVLHADCIEVFLLENFCGILFLAPVRRRRYGIRLGLNVDLSIVDYVRANLPFMANVLIRT